MLQRILFSRLDVIITKAFLFFWCIVTIFDISFH